MKKKTVKMPPPHGVNRYYYPLVKRPTSLSAERMRDLAPDPCESMTDPDGSYTGRPVDGGKPVQDADDL